MFIKLYLIAVSVFFAIDIVWLGLVVKNFYSKQIGFLMRENVLWLPALVFYLLFVVGLVFFVISPALQKRDLTLLLTNGALFGLITYATYDLTNLATLKDWPITLTLVDLVWGMTLSSVVSLVTYFIYLKFWS